MEHKLTQGDVLIIQNWGNQRPAPIKVSVEEETETTYLLDNLDYQSPAIGEVEPGTGYLVKTDDIAAESYEEIAERLQRNIWQVVRKQPLNHPFRITKKEFESTYEVIEVVETRILPLKSTISRAEQLAALHTPPVPKLEVGMDIYAIAEKKHSSGLNVLTIGRKHKIEKVGDFCFWTIGNNRISLSFSHEDFHRFFSLTPPIK